MNSQNKQPVVICADDFGMSPGVNRAIVELVKKGRISAVSVLTHLPDWQQTLVLAREISGQVDLGVQLFLSSRSHWKDRQREIALQVDRFRLALHRHPDFICGHHHLHQWPSVQRDVLVQLKKASVPMYTRQTELPEALVSWSLPKTVLINWLGKRWKKRVVKNGIPVNDFFAGVYDYENVRTLDHVFAQFRQFARSLKGKRPIWMVHPGEVDELLVQRDKLVSARQLEYQVLASDRWAEFMAGSNLEVCRFFDSSSRNSTDFLKFF